MATATVTAYDTGLRRQFHLGPSARTPTREAHCAGYPAQVRFVLDVNLPETPEAAAELGRILRYWGGAMDDLAEVGPGDKQDIYDSAYNRIGAWWVSADAD
jgi:hypothetical protein